MCLQNFRNPDELWQQTQDTDGSHGTWYQKAVSYWDQQEASYNGVLGGFGHVSEADVRDSKQLIEKVNQRRLHACMHARHAWPALLMPRLSTCPLGRSR